MANAKPIDLCRVECSIISSQKSGYQTGCSIKPLGNLVCQAGRIEPDFYCVAEKSIAGAGCNPAEEFKTIQGCYNRGADGSLQPLALSQCPGLEKSSSTTASSQSTTTTSQISSTSAISSSASTTTSGYTSSSVGNNTISPAINPAVPEQTQSTKAAKGGLPSGAVAGVAIGALIAGAAVAGLIFLFLLQRYRKRSKNASSGGHSPFNEEAISHGKPQIVVGNTHVAHIDTFLPQPAEDDAISGELSRIRDKIKDHVQSFYITSTVSPNSVDQTKLLDLAAATGLSTAKLQDMFLSPRSRTAAIRLYLAWVILSRCGTQKSNGLSFLPGEVAAFAALLSANDSRNNAKLVLSTKWKAISGELLQSEYGNKRANNPSLEAGISQAMTAADIVLIPFVDSSIEASSDKRIRNLENIMRRAAQFAFLLFSQPSIFAFEWTAQKGGIVVFPGLQQVVDEDGNVSHPPRVFGEPEIGGT